MTMADDGDTSFWLYKCPKLDAWLKEACAVYLPGYPQMSPTAMRQFWETVAHHDTGELAEKIAKAQEAMNNAMDHGGKVGMKHYKKGKALKVTRESKACTIAYYDGFVAWPGADLTDEFFAENRERVRAKFAAAVCASKGDLSNAAIENEPSHEEE